MNSGPAVSSPPPLVLDFERDWRDMVAAKLTGMGYQASSAESTHELGITYYNALRRRIVSHPRSVQVADIFSCPPDLTAGLALLRSAVERGDDLTPFLSGRLRKRDYHDRLLNDWGIFHFHLSATGTGFVLFAAVTDVDFYMLDCRLHGRSAPQQPWPQQDLLEIIHRNWPSLIRFARAPVAAIHPEDVLTDADVADFRRAGIQGIFKMSDGTVYLPPGGGLTTSKKGVGAAVVAQLHHTIAQLSYLERWVHENIGTLIQFAQQRGVSLGPVIHLHLIYDPPTPPRLVEEATGFQCQIVGD